MVAPVPMSTARAAVLPSESEGAESALVSLGSGGGAAAGAADAAAQANAATTGRSSRRLTPSTVDRDRDGAPPPGEGLRRRRHPEIDDVALDCRTDVGGHRRAIARDEHPGAERDHRRVDRDHADAH